MHHHVLVDPAQCCAVAPTNCCMRLLPTACGKPHHRARTHARDEQIVVTDAERAEAASGLSATPLQRQSSSLPPLQHSPRSHTERQQPFNNTLLRPSPVRSYPLAGTSFLIRSRSSPASCIGEPSPSGGCRRAWDKRACGCCGQWLLPATAQGAKVRSRAGDWWPWHSTPLKRRSGGS